MITITEDDVTESLDALTDALERYRNDPRAGNGAAQLTRLACEISTLADRTESTGIGPPDLAARMRSMAAQLRDLAAMERRCARNRLRIVRD
jgi:hypothetical protein